MSTSKSGVSTLWPRDKFPEVRRRVAKTYRALYSAVDVARYLAWSSTSKLVHGPRRAVRVYGTNHVIVNSDDYRGFRIHSAGGTQKEKIEVWSQLLDLQPKLVLDVGANYGEFSVVAAEMGVNGIAIEANPRVASCLAERFAARTNFRVLNIAASDHDGSLKFFFNRNASGSGSMSAEIPGFEKRVLNLGRVEEANVNCQKLDHVVSGQSGALPESFIIKIDVEGFEATVLDGAKDLIRAAKWWRGIVEFSPGAMQDAGQDASKLWNMLREWNGMILEKGMSSGQMIGWTDDHPKLPAHPPTGECDVVIGRGQPQNKG